MAEDRARLHLGRSDTPARNGLAAKAAFASPDNVPWIFFWPASYEFEKNASLGLATNIVDLNTQGQNGADNLTHRKVLSKVYGVSECVGM